MPPAILLILVIFLHGKLIVGTSDNICYVANRELDGLVGYPSLFPYFFISGIMKRKEEICL